MSESEVEPSNAVEAVMATYAVSESDARAALSKALASTPFSEADLDKLLSDPDRNPLPEAATRGYRPESVLDVITKLAMMLGRSDLRLTSSELKGLWSAHPPKPKPTAPE